MTKTANKPDKARQGVKPAPMRRGRPPKGNAAEGRDKLLTAAMTLFGEQAPDSVSTRQLATAAGVNLSAITYHFGGKDQLYEAVIRKAIDDMAPRRQAVISFLDSALNEADGDREKLAASIRAFVQAFFEVLVQDDFPFTTFQLLLRQLHNPTSAFELVIKHHINPVHDAITRLTAVALGCDEDDPEARLLGMSVTSQVLMLGVLRPVVLARMGWTSYSAENAETVIKTTTTSILRLLGLPEDDYKKRED